MDTLILLTISLGINRSLYGLILGLGRAVIAWLYCYAGVLLWRGKPSARWYAAGPAFLSTVGLAIGGRTPALYVALATNVAILLLVIANWRALAGSSDQVGA